MKILHCEWVDRSAKAFGTCRPLPRPAGCRTWPRPRHRPGL